MMEFNPEHQYVYCQKISEKYWSNHEVRDFVIKKLEKSLKETIPKDCAEKVKWTFIPPDPYNDNPDLWNGTIMWKYSPNG